MNGIFKAIAVVFFCVSATAISPPVASAQLAASSPHSQPDWESVFGYRPFGSEPLKVEHSIIVYWANYMVMEMLTVISKDGILLQEKQNKILSNVFTDDGKTSLSDLYRKIGYDRILEDKALMQRIEAMPVTLGSIKMMKGLPDKDGDGKSDGAAWQVLVEYGLSIWTGRKGDNEQLVEQQERKKRAEVMIDVVRPRGQDKLYIAGVRLVSFQDAQ